MSTLGPLLQGFFTDRLVRQRHASGHTVLAYRNTIRLLLRFAWQKTGKQPAQLTLEDLDAPLIGDFLHYLETDRGNSVATATPGWPRSTRCSATPPSTPPSTPPPPNACWPSPRNAPTAPSSVT